MLAQKKRKIARDVRRPSSRKRFLWLAAAAAAGVAILWSRRYSRPQWTREPEVAGVQRPAPLFWKTMVFPTDQQGLLDTDRSGVFQPTASGKIESALYGSVRTARRGNAIVPSFHEGIDIAPLQRNRAGQPLDKVYAVADGTVGYINRLSGNSNYGIYVVLIHRDPVGDVYTLYAHLASVSPSLAAGQTVRARDTLGIMGRTPPSSIPSAQAHLHFEIGLIGNSRFEQWFKAHRLKPDHGMFNGWNLLGVDPLGVFEARRKDPDFDFRSYLATVARAFEIVIPTSRQIDFFLRYPPLWKGDSFCPGAIVVSASENGVPLEGRNATTAEKDALKGRRYVLQNVDEGALGRNGSRLIVERSDAWRLGRNGETWLDILTF